MIRNLFVILSTLFTLLTGTANASILMRSICPELDMSERIDLQKVVDPILVNIEAVKTGEESKEKLGEALNNALPALCALEYQMLQRRAILYKDGVISKEEEPAYNAEEAFRTSLFGLNMAIRIGSHDPDNLLEAIRLLVSRKETTELTWQDLKTATTPQE